jgi:hypothetical protein
MVTRAYDAYQRLVDEGAAAERKTRDLLFEAFESRHVTEVKHSTARSVKEQVVLLIQLALEGLCTSRSGSSQLTSTSAPTLWEGSENLGMIFMF